MQIANIFQYDDHNLFVIATYNPWLVLLSISIAILASYMGFQVAYQAQYRSSIRKNLLLFVGSIALGGGVWSMHFIGMLALELCTTINYQFTLTALSLLPSIAASWVALSLITRKEIKLQQLIFGGVLVGSGIGTMHYIGMAAMEMAPLLRYNLGIFCISILVAICLAILALWISFGLEKKAASSLSKSTKIMISSVVMAAAISSMHYIGMAAARFVLPPGMELSTQTNGISQTLALVITAITVTIILTVLAINLIFRYKDTSIAAMNNERRLIATMDTAIDGIITISSNGIIISINKAVSHLLGWTSDELIGQNVKMIVPFPDQAHHDNYIANYLKTREAKIIGKGREVEVLTKTGELIPVRLGIGHVELNQQHQFVAFISDLRERKAMENELKQNEAKIRSLLTNIPGIAYRCLDIPGWPNLFINDEVEKMLGYPAEDFLLPTPKRGIADFVHPEDLQKIINTDLRHPDGYQLEFRIIDRYKNTKWVLGYGRALKIEESEGYYLDGFIMDITDRKKMESALISEKERAEKAAATRTAFLANMSHEIRTPMNAIIGFSDILLDEKLPSSQRKQLNTINQSAKSLLHILNDVLDSAKLEKGKFQLEYRDFSLVEEVDSVISTLWLQAQKKQISINLNIEKNCQRFYNGAPDRIRQVLTNLIGNAIKFTEHGSISINIKSHQVNELCFSISDTGIGMTPTQLEIIFDAFAQADESMSRRFGGTGLGTTISKQLVELMGGTISAQSQHGKGSVFTFNIPVTLTDVKSHIEAESNHSELPPLKILVVDDIEQNIDLLKLILKRYDHSVCTAINGEQALLKMEKEALDLVLMDIQMPVMDGLTAAIKRREFELENKLPRLPILALTASVLPQDKMSAEQAGMDGFANKPIDIKQLMDEIKVVFNTLEVKPLEQSIETKQQLKIDLEKGVDLWGSKTSLFNEISRFLTQSHDDMAALNSLVEIQNWKALENMAHKYKGVTGNLALNRLMLMFTELEQASQTHNEKEVLKSTQNIDEEISSIIECANNMSLNTAKANTVNNQESSSNELLDSLAKLKESVEKNEFDEALLDKLPKIKSEHAQAINHIVIACNDFDFELASSLITTLSSSIAPQN